MFFVFVHTTTETFEKSALWNFKAELHSIFIKAYFFPFFSFYFFEKFFCVYIYFFSLRNLKIQVLINEKYQFYVWTNFVLMFSYHAFFFFLMYSKFNRIFFQCKNNYSYKAVLKSKLTTLWYISKGAFYHKRIKFVNTLISSI